MINSQKVIGNLQVLCVKAGMLPYSGKIRTIGSNRSNKIISESFNGKEIENKPNLNNQDNKDKQKKIVEEKDTKMHGEQIHHASQEELKKAIIWSEILGEPVCKTRRNRNQRRR